MSTSGWLASTRNLAISFVMAPCSYQAVATYSASTSYQVATGYVTTAEYKGEVVAEGVDSITYTVVYVGTEIVPETFWMSTSGWLASTRNLAISL